MSETAISTVEGRDASGQDEAPYRPLCAPAMAGLLLALVSPAAFWHPVLWLVPLAAVVSSLVALSRIRKAGFALAGRGAAVVALVLALAVGTAAPARLLTRNYILRSEARKFGDQWFTYVLEGQPHKAHQLTKEPARRYALNDSLWDAYQSSEERRDLTFYASNDPVRTLMALREMAKVQYYDTEEQSEAVDGNLISDVYAVTFEHLDEKKTFFVLLRQLRSVNPENGVTGWRIIEARGPYNPKKWNGP